MKRLYYLTSDINSAENISKNLHDNGITNWHFHVSSKDEAGLKHHHINSAGPVQQLDIIHAGERGALFAFPIGLFIALFIMLTEPFGNPINFITMAFITVVITMFGAWVGGMVGLLHENYKIAKFHKNIEDGQYLIMLDIKKNQLDKFKGMMKNCHPEAIMAGEDTTFINPFKKSSYHHV